MRQHFHNHWGKNDYAMRTLEFYLRAGQNCLMYCPSSRMEFLIDWYRQLQERYERAGALQLQFPGEEGSIMMYPDEFAGEVSPAILEAINHDRSL